MTSWFLILFGVILAQAVVLNLRFHHQAKGYLLRAATWIWSTLVLVIFFETLVALALVKLGSKIISLELPPVLFLVGILVVMLPKALEDFFLRNFTEKKIKGWVGRFLRKLNLAAIRAFGGAIRTRMEQDVFDWQTQSEKHFGLDAEKFRQKIRQVYYCHMQDVAALRRDASFLRRDAGFSPYCHLYILAGHLGRKRLINELRNSCDIDWDGHEKRRVRGVTADRAMSGPGVRFYDIPEILEDILNKYNHKRISKRKKVSGVDKKTVSKKKITEVKKDQIK